MYEQRGTYVSRKRHCDHRDRGSWVKTKSSNVHRVVYSFRFSKLTTNNCEFCWLTMSTPRTIISVLIQINWTVKRCEWQLEAYHIVQNTQSGVCTTHMSDTYNTLSARGRYHFNVSLLQTMSVFNIIQILNMLVFRLTENMKVVFSFVTLLLWFGRVVMQPSSRKYQLWVTGDATRC